MRRVIPLIGSCLLLIAVAETAFAQQRLFARMDREIVELDSRPSSFGDVIRRFTLPLGSGSATNQDVVSFAGGAFLAWASAEARSIYLLDTFSGGVQQFGFFGFIPTRIIGTDGNARLLVGGTNGERQLVLVADAHTGRVRVLDVGYAIPPAVLAYAPAGNVLFVARRAGTSTQFGYWDIDVIDVGIGNVLKTLNLSPIAASSLTVNAAGTRLYVAAPTGSYAFDVITGARLAENLSSTAFGTLVVDEPRRRLLSRGLGIEALDLDSLQPLGVVSVPRPPRPPRHVGVTTDLDVSAQSATMFVYESSYVSNGFAPVTCFDSHLLALDVATGQLRRTADLTAVTGSSGCQLDLIRLTEPPSPEGVSADVAQRRLTLTWPAAVGATRYEIEAGSAPGLADLATVSVTDAQLSVEGVPLGVYYLRVRALNTIGKSAPSQEIRVVVQ